MRVRLHAQADADRLSSEIGVNFTPLLFDVTDEAAALAALGGETLYDLVNDASIAVAAPVLELSAHEFRRQLDVNVIGSIIAPQAFGPLFGSDASLKGKAGADRDDQLGGRQEWQPADVGLLSLETLEVRYSINRREPILISKATARISSRH